MSKIDIPLACENEIDAVDFLQRALARTPKKLDNRNISDAWYVVIYYSIYSRISTHSVVVEEEKMNFLRVEDLKDSGVIGSKNVFDFNDFTNFTLY